MKKNLHFFARKINFILIFSFSFLIFVISSSFKNNNKNLAFPPCTGPFATTNILGSGFAILGPGGAGAPGEGGTCGRGGCHNTVDNTGPATTFSLNIGGGVTQYVPGQTYTVTVTIAQAAIIAFDFEVTNRPAAGGANATGTFVLTDATRTRKSNGSFGGAGNNYVEGTYCGVDQLSPGFNQWSFNWTAPAVAVGNITFYLGVVAANFNNQATGDFTYSLSKVLTPGLLGVNEMNNDKTNFNLYPNPTAENITVDYHLKNESNVSIKIMDVKGAQVDLLLTEKENSGDHQHNFNLNSKKYSAGIYFVQVAVDDKIITRKLFVQ